jgi:hypothetical protein
MKLRTSAFFWLQTHISSQWKNVSAFREGLLMNLQTCKYDIMREVAERSGFTVADEEEVRCSLASLQGS